MKKTLSIILALVLVAVIVVIVVTRNKSTRDTDVSSDNKTVVSGSFADLARLGEDYQCEFMKEGDDFGSLSGAVFVSGGQVRGSYDLVDLSGSSSTIEVLLDNEFTYVWGEGPFGDFAIKTPLPDIQESQEEGVMKQAGSEDQNFDFDCAPWSPRTGTFDAPKNIEFVEMGANVPL